MGFRRAWSPVRAARLVSAAMALVSAGVLGEYARKAHLPIGRIIRIEFVRLATALTLRPSSREGGYRVMLH
jgi:hypothetical protein